MVLTILVSIRISTKSLKRAYISQKNSRMWGRGSLPRHYAYQKERSIPSWNDQSLQWMYQKVPVITSLS